MKLLPKPSELSDPVQLSLLHIPMGPVGVGQVMACKVHVLILGNPSTKDKPAEVNPMALGATCF